MKSIMEWQLINGRKMKSVEREAQDKSIIFLTVKYQVASAFFYTIWLLDLCDVADKWRAPFGFSYYADRLTQRHTFGKYDGTRPERGSRNFDEYSLHTVPTWFSKSS